MERTEQHGLGQCMEARLRAQTSNLEAVAVSQGDALANEQQSFLKTQLCGTNAQIQAFAYLNQPMCPGIRVASGDRTLRLLQHTTRDNSIERNVGRRRKQFQNTKCSVMECPIASV